MSRVLCWFSCGAASAVAAKKTIEEHGDRVEVLYCDTFKHEHPDNLRFFLDVEHWLGREIKVLKAEKYDDIFDVFQKTKWLVGRSVARCTIELKKMPRIRYQRPDDIHVFGYTFEEHKRIARFGRENPELSALFPLQDRLISKADCHRIISEAGIEQPAMYRMGYKNNNCIGCVKGGAGYWNRIRVDFPAAFARMATTERAMGVSCIRLQTGGLRRPVFLDELPPDAENSKTEADIECGVLCINESEE